MKIGYTSDLHIDFFMRDAQCNEKLFSKHLEKYFDGFDAKHLIIGGDIGHYPSQNMLFLDLIRTKYNIENIITVGSNHSCYLVNDKQRSMFKNGLQKMAYENDLFSENGITVLDGNTTEIEGITIGGSTSWYDGSIYNKFQRGYGNVGSLNDYWKRTMNDSKYMNLDDFTELAQEEKKKFLNLKDKVDLMVSHVFPIVSDKYFPEIYQGQMSNAFYSFDWEENIALDTRLQAWIFGHTHTVHTCDFFGKRIISNPMGYPNELDSTKKMRYIEFNDGGLV